MVESWQVTVGTQSGPARFAGVSRIRFHGPEVGVVFALSIGFPSVVWGQWHGEMPTVVGAVWFSRGVGYAPRSAYVYANGRVVVAVRERGSSRENEKAYEGQGGKEIGEGRINPGGKRRRISQRDLSPCVCLCVCSLSSGNDRAPARERGISPSLRAGARSYVHPRIYTRAASGYIATPERGLGGKEKERDAERYRERERDRERTRRRSRDALLRSEKETQTESESPGFDPTRR